MTTDKDLEKKIRQFLLGRLGAEERMAIEIELAASQTAFARMRQLEDELIQDYADGELPAAEMASVADEFLVSPERRRKLIFSRAFRSLVDKLGKERDDPRLRKRSIWDWLTDLFRVRVPVLAPASAFALLLVAVAVAFWSLTQLNQLQSDFAAVQGEQFEMVVREEQTRRELDRARESNELLKQELTELRTTRNLLENQIPDLKDRIGGPTFATFLLSPGVLRDGSLNNQIRIAPNQPVVELLLDIGLNDFASYRAVLTGIEDEELVTYSQLEAVSYQDTVAVRLMLPAETFSSGDYAVRLVGITSSGQTETIFRYSLRVLR